MRHPKAGRNTEQSARIFIRFSFFTCFCTTEREIMREIQRERKDRETKRKGEKEGGRKNRRE